MRATLLVATLASSVLAALAPEVTAAANVRAANPCEMEPRFSASAQAFIRGVLTDTGESGATFAMTRSELGISGVTYNQIVIVQDTTKCRSAIDAWKAHFATLSTELGQEAARFDRGMLFRITPNRYILATPRFNKYSLLTYIALDSNWIVIRKNL